MKNKRIKVAQIIGRVAEGGVEKMIMNLYEHIDHTKVVFDFFVENTSIIVDEKVINRFGGKVIIIPSYKKLFKFKSLLKQKLLEGNYDIVHANMNALSFIPLKIAKQCNIPIRISHSHSTSNKKELLRHFIKNLLRPFSKKYATHYIACSELAGSWLFGKKAIEQGKIEYIDNAVDVEKYRFNTDKRNELRNNLCISNDSKIIGHVGRFCSQKNQLYLLDIFEKLLKLDLNYRLLLIGNGEQLEEAKQIVINKNIQNVHFIGTVPNVNDYYNSMDCFVLPSLYEGLPVVGVEAQANNLKCFFSTFVTEEAKLLSSTEYIELDKGPEYWASKIHRYLSSNVLRVEGTIPDKYDINKMSDKLLSLYIEYIGE